MYSATPNIANIRQSPTVETTLPFSLGCKFPFSVAHTSITILAQSFRLDAPTRGICDRVSTQARAGDRHHGSAKAQFGKSAGEEKTGAAAQRER